MIWSTELAMPIDAAILARVQFAFTISFHIVFPAFTIGLSAYIAVLHLLWLKTGRDKFATLARFWTKIFAVSFAMGVVSGIVLSYQFGTNWSRFSQVTGNVLGPLLGYEVLTAFFLEATFLGIMLFGWNRVPPWLQAIAACVVAIGTSISAFWILAANSWMQAPMGHEVRDGIAYPLDWWQIVFNPTFPLRLAHMLTAAYLTTAFVVLATGARHLMRGIRPEESRTMMRMAAGMILVTAPLQALIGHEHGRDTAKYQPAKLAAMEAHWDGSKPGALVLFAIPRDREERNDYEISIPYGASLIVFGDPNALFKGLKDFPPDLRPPVLVPFFAFRVMVGIGVFMIAWGVWGALRWWRGTLYDGGLYLAVSRNLWPIGFVAILSGWFVTEVGRQPWIATGILRTADALSPVVFWKVATSLVLFIIVYSVVFTAGIRLINKLIDKGPIDLPQPAATTLGANRPLSGAAREFRGAPAGTGG
jgi:cytochrome bd ubiquinol oxidase subunit I